MKKSFTFGRTEYNKAGTVLFVSILVAFIGLFVWVGNISTSTTASLNEGDSADSGITNNNTTATDVSDLNNANSESEQYTAPTDYKSPSTATTNSNYAPNGTYQNVYGNTVARPYESDSVPAGASARCGDGSYSFSQSRSGTCSHHGGVTDWL